VNYRQTADRISSVVATLRGLSDEQSDAKSVDVVIEAKDQVAESIQRAEGRYRAAGDALVEYAEVLDSAQASSAHALGQAQAARRDADLQRKTAQKWGREAKQATDADEKTRYKRFQRQAEGNAADHEAMVGVWKRQVDQASRDVDVAAQKACDQINTVTGTDGLNDSWWDNLASVLEAVAKLAETISAITGILGMLLAWVPILGPALLAISAITGVIAAICNVALAAGGKQSWDQALKSVFFAAIGCLGLGGLKGILGSIKGLALFGKTAKNAGGIAKFLKTAAVTGVRDFAANARSVFTMVRCLPSLLKKMNLILGSFRGPIAYYSRSKPTAFGNLPRVPMDFRSVRNVAKKYDINIRDLRIRINKSMAGVCGVTAPNQTVTLCRDAFKNEVELAKTLVHERVHVEDIRAKMKYPDIYDPQSEAEARAERIAQEWWDTYGQEILTGEEVG
jgi:hypothetical protein